MKTKAVNTARLPKSSILFVSLEIYDILCWIIMYTRKYLNTLEVTFLVHIFMIFGQNICFLDTTDEFENGSDR